MERWKLFSGCSHDEQIGVYFFTEESFHFVVIVDKQRVKHFLIELGLEKDESSIYLSLSKLGISTPLEISRDTKIDRARVYRRLESMKKRGLVHEVIGEKRKMYEARGIEKLHEILQTKKMKLEGLQKSFNDVKAYLTAHVGLHEAETKVVFYRGRSGIKQLVWNVLRAETEVVGYTYRALIEITGEKFRRRWRDEFIRRGLRMRDLYSDKYLRSRKGRKEQETWVPENVFENRYVSSDILDIDHQLDIYNDVVAYYNWYEGEVFGVEIYNRKVAKMQKQLFEVVWDTVAKRD